MNVTTQKVAFVTLLAIATVCAPQSRAEPPDIAQMLADSWERYKNIKISSNGQVWCDDSSAKTVTFSEGQSYALLRAFWRNDREVFNAVWQWTKANLQRQNVPQFYWANQKKWISAADPDWKRVQDRLDHLFAWRWLADAERSGHLRGGITYYEYTDLDKDWLDGFDSASDADLDIALALVLAARAWNVPQYLEESRSIMDDIWAKEVSVFDSRNIDDFDKQVLSKWYQWTSSGKSGRPGNIDMSNAPGYGDTGWCLRFVATTSSNWPDDSYAGVGKTLDRDAVAFEGIELVWRGASQPVRIQLRDSDDEAYYADAIPTSNWRIIKIFFSSFRRDQYSGNLNGNRTLDKQLIRQFGLAPRDASNSTFEVDQIRFFGGSNSLKYFFSAGDRYQRMADTDNAIGINPSYLAPYAFRFFAEVDTNHNWTALVDSSYEILQTCGRSIFTNSMGVTFTGVGLPPNWIQVNKDGSIGPQEWPSWRNDFHFNHKYWDAFRTLFRVTLDNRWFHTKAAQAYLATNGPRAFLTTQLQTNNRLISAYYYDGQPAPSGIPVTAITATYATFLKETGTDVSGLLQSINAEYHAEGYWGDNGYDYFNQNWTWLALALLSDCLPRDLARLTATPKLPNGGFQLLLTGETGRAYTLQASTDFFTWHHVTNSLGSDVPQPLTDWNIVNFNQRFYRVISP